MRVPPCSFVVRWLLYVLLCVFMLRRVPLRIRVSPETRQRLQRLRTERHLNVGPWLRTVIDEALDREFGPAPTDANEAAPPVKAVPPEPIPGWTPARLEFGVWGTRFQMAHNVKRKEALPKKSRISWESLREYWGTLEPGNRSPGPQSSRIHLESGDGPEFKSGPWNTVSGVKKTRRVFTSNGLQELGSNSVAKSFRTNNEHFL